MKTFTLPPSIKFLGTLLTIISLLFLISFPFGAYSVLDETNPKELSDTLIAIATYSFIIFISLNYIFLHRNLKKYSNDNSYRKKFINSYIICCVITAILTFVFCAFIRNLSQIILLIIFFLPTIIYILKTHKYTKKDGREEL